MKVLQGLIIFLAVALIIFVGATVMFAFKCNYLYALKDDEDSRIEELEADNKVLLTEKLQLHIKYDELYDDNVKLTAAIKELRQINKELMNDKAVQETPAPAETEIITLLHGKHTNMIRCEPYKFAKGSQQAKLQEVCQTDTETGIRYYDDGQTKWLCAALAGAFGTEIGHAYAFTLANGEMIPVIMSDFKHSIDDVRADDYGDADRNYLGDDCINVIEFVVDMVAVPEEVKQAGTMTALDMFGGLYSYDGDIIEMKDEGRVWRP